MASTKSVPAGFRVPSLSPFAASFLASYGALALGGTFARIDDWYRDLTKPEWTPPGPVIAIVWWILYTLIAVASALAWSSTSQRPSRRLLVVLLAVNFVLNVGWSFVFFTMRRLDVASLEILALLASTVALAFVAGRRRSVAGWLLLPYAAWVGFASFLCIAIWRLNT